MTELDALGAELRALRDENRINSQAELARLSKVSQSQIKLIEAGKTATKPSTLMLLSRGLGTDVEGNVDGKRVEAIYARLMRAAGFLPRPSNDDDESDSRADFLEEMERKTGRKDLALALSTVAFNFDRIPRRHRRVLEEMILSAAEDIAEADRRAN